MKEKIRKTSLVGYIWIRPSVWFLDEFHEVEQLSDMVIRVGSSPFYEFACGTPQMNQILGKSSKLEIINKTT